MGGGSSPETDRIGSIIGNAKRPHMEYFAGLDVSMAETHVCVMNRDDAVMHEAKVPSTPTDSGGARPGSGRYRNQVDLLA
jgi:hypothetical protein